MTSGHALVAGLVVLSGLVVALFVLYRREAAAKARLVDESRRRSAGDVSASSSGKTTDEPPPLSTGSGSAEGADRAGASTSGSPIIDQDVLNDLLDSLGPEDFGQVVDVFLADMPPLMDRLAGSVARQDAISVFATAHEGKGTAASLGLSRLAEVMGRIETSARTAQPYTLNPLLEEAQEIWAETAYAIDSTFRG